MAIKKPTNHWFVGFCLLTVLFCPVSSAEREGFEPPVPCSTTVFKTAAIDHSATSPMPLSFKSDAKVVYFYKYTKFWTYFFIFGHNIQDNKLQSNI